MPRELAVLNEREPLTMLRPYGLDREMELRDLWDIFVRRRNIVFATLVACLFAGALVCAFGTRRYMATAELQVGREVENNLGLQTDGNQEPPADSLAENVTIQTQAGILQSDTLALKVINDLGLESTQDFRPTFDLVGRLMSPFVPAGIPDPANAALEDSPRRRARALEIFSRNLEVRPVSGTRLVQISYLNPDPQLAAQIVNHVANSLQDYNFQIRHDATSHTAEWLAGQMSDLRKQSEALQAKVAQLQHESGVFSLGETDISGREQVYSSVLDKLQQATTALSQAQASRVGKAAIYEVVQTGDPEAISQLSGSSIFASSAGLDSSLSLIQSMRMQESTLRGQIAEMASKFGPAYPKLNEARSHLDALDDTIHSEVNRVAQRAKNDYEVARRVEDNAREIYTEQKHQADLVNDKTIEYMIARKEAEESRNLYESLFRQLKQSGVLAGFRANNISLVDPARVPARPAKPKVSLYMAAALAGGLLLGVGAALVKDGVDTRIHNIASLESNLGQVPIGMLPYHEATRSRLGTTSGPQPLKRDIQDPAMNHTVLPVASRMKDNEGKFEIRSRSRRLRMPALEEPRSEFVEALRALRTSLLLSKGRIAPQVILVTSSTPGEGKSMLSANLAAILADQQRNVLLVDADLRHPTLHHVFDINGDTGLSWMLTGTNLEDPELSFDTTARSVVVPVADVSHLYVVPSGPVPEYPTELLSSDRMSDAITVWRNHFDYIVIDGSPVLPVTDSVVLSGIVDFTLLLARYQVVEQQALNRAYSLLRLRADQNNIGIVVNAVQKAATYYPGVYQDRINERPVEGRRKNA